MRDITLLLPHMRHTVDTGGSGRSSDAGGSVPGSVPPNVVAQAY